MATENNKQVSQENQERMSDECHVDQLWRPINTPEYIPPEEDWPTISEADWNNGEDVGSYSPTSPVYGTDEICQNVSRSRSSSPRNRERTTRSRSRSSLPRRRGYTNRPPSTSPERHRRRNRSPSTSSERYRRRNRSPSTSPERHRRRDRGRRRQHRRRRSQRNERSRSSRIAEQRRSLSSEKNMRDENRGDISTDRSSNDQSDLSDDQQGNQVLSRGMSLLVHVVNEHPDDSLYHCYTNHVKNIIAEMHAIISRSHNLGEDSCVPIEVEANPACQADYTMESRASFIAELSDVDLHVIFEASPTEGADVIQRGNYVIIPHHSGIFDKLFERHTAIAFCRLFGSFTTGEGMSEELNLDRLHLDPTTIATISRTKFYLHHIKRFSKGISYRTIGSLLEIQSPSSITAVLQGSIHGTLLEAKFLEEETKYIEFRPRMADIIVVIDQDGAINKIKL